MNALRVLVAPDSFKGTLSAAQVATALASGIRAAGAEADVCPVADGGEGTVEALRSSIPGRDVELMVTAPDGREVRVSYLIADAGRVAVVETATASGLHLIDPATVDAFAATSTGTGQLIGAAAAAGAREILLGVGGSGFSDGGAGALEAIESAGGLRGARLVVLCDVTTPYEDAARIYGPQKGADLATVRRLTSRLQEMAGRFPRDPRGVPRTGAAWGLAGALWAVHGAQLVSGIDEVLHRVNFAARLSAADLVLTGEGRLDAQTVQGKVMDGITRWARRATVPVRAVVGQNHASMETLASLGLVDVHEARNSDQLRATAATLIRQLTLQEVIP